MQSLREQFQVSQRRACELLGCARSSVRYMPKQTDDVLREQLIELAKEKPRFGYRRLHILLTQQGQQVNHMV